MQKIIAISSIFLFVAIGCSDFDRRTQFNTTYINRITLDSMNTKPGIEHEVFSDTLNTDFDELLNDHNSDVKSIENVRMEALSIEIDRKKSSRNGNFNFLKNLRVFIKGKDAGEFLIGKADSVPDGGVSYFEMKVLEEGKDFTDFLKSEQFICRVKYRTESPVRDTAVVIKIVPNYRIDTKKLGI